MILLMHIRLPAPSVQTPTCSNICRPGLKTCFTDPGKAPGTRGREDDTFFRKSTQAGLLRPLSPLDVGPRFHVDLYVVEEVSRL